VLIDESGFFLNPTVRKSQAPKGQTPVLESFAGHRDKVSAIAALSVSPRAGRVGLYFATETDRYISNVEVADFLRELLRHLRGRVVVLWDGGPNHKGEPIRDVLRRYGRLHVERLPAYSPELNPVECVWSYLKYGKLANFVPGNVSHLDDVVLEHLIDSKFTPGLLHRLWKGSDLPFPERQSPSEHQ
jgi:transposase